MQYTKFSKRDEVTGEWRKLHSEERNEPYSSSNIILRIKSRRMRWEGHVLLGERGEWCTGVWWGNLREKDHLEDLGIDGKIILRWLFRKWDVRVWTGLT